DCIQESKSTIHEQDHRFQLKKLNYVGRRENGLNFSEDDGFFVRATYAHSFDVESLPRILPSNDIDYEASLNLNDSHAPDRFESIPQLQELVVDYIVKNLKKYADLGECLDDELLRRILVKLKK